MRTDLHVKNQNMHVILGSGIVFVTILHFCSAQVPFLGPCPDMKTMPDFETNRYMGKWYEAERYFSVFEFAGKCVSANYTIGEDGKLTITSRQTSSLTGIQSAMEGEVRLEERMDSSKLNVRFPSLPVWHLAVLIDAPYWVLETDYDNYSVVWSCTNFGLFSTRNAWILTRARYPTLEIMEQAYGVIDRNAISRAYFIRTDQNNCPENHRR